MAVVMDGAIAADAGIITGGAEVVATTMVGGIIAIGDSNLPDWKEAASIRGSCRRGSKHDDSPLVFQAYLSYHNIMPIQDKKIAKKESKKRNKNKD